MFKIIIGMLAALFMADIASSQVIEEPLGHEAVFDGQNAWPIISRSGPYYGGDPNGAGLNQTLLVQVNGEIWEMVVRNRNVLSLTSSTEIPLLPAPSGMVGGFLYLTEADCFAGTNTIPFLTIGAMDLPNADFLEVNGEFYPRSGIPLSPVFWWEATPSVGGGCFAGHWFIVPSGPGLNTTGAERLFDPAITKEIVPVGPYSYVPEPSMGFGLAAGVLVMLALR